MTALATDSGRKTPARLAGSAILAMQSDERLVKLVRSGHERAFDAIVQRYQKPLVDFCRRILPESRCEDAVQQAFLNAHVALATSDNEVQLKPWLYAITRNAALNMLRQNGWNYEQIPTDFDGVRRPDQVFEQRFELEQTVAALNDLPERQRDALVMREFEGRSYDEIALALGANGGAVRQLLNRARVTLRNAASLLVPPPLVARAAASMPPADGRRVAELFAGMGAAGAAKAGATALVAGSLVVGAVEAPLPVGGSHKTTREKATIVPAKSTAARHPSGSDQTVALRGNAAAPVKRQAPHASRRPTSRHSGETRRGGERVEPVEREHSGRGTLEQSGSGNTGSTGDRSGSRDRSGSGGSGSSGRSGSDDVATAPTTTDDHGGTSGTSGSGTSDGSGTSGSGGDGVSDSGTSGSGSSGSDGSGSGSSGSGSGSDDTTTTSTTPVVTDSSGSSGSGSGSTSLEH